MKLKISRSKNSCSFYVQKTIRKENGSTTTITVEKLGNLDAIKAKANGKDPYEWAQDYVNELNRNNMNIRSPKKTSPERTFRNSGKKNNDKNK